MNNDILVAPSEDDNNTSEKTEAKKSKAKAGKFRVLIKYPESIDKIIKKIGSLGYLPFPLRLDIVRTAIMEMDVATMMYVVESFLKRTPDQKKDGEQE